MSKDLLFIDLHERKSATVLEDTFDLVQKALGVGDLLHPESQSLIELKIGNDAHNYERLFDELTRMNTAIYSQMRKYCVFVAEDCTDTLKDYTILVSACNRTGVIPIFIGRLELLPARIKEIIRGGYLSPLQQQHVCSKELSQEAKILAAYNGCSDEKAIAITDLIYQDMTLESALDGVYGENADGSRPKIAEDIYCFFHSLFRRWF